MSTRSLEEEARLIVASLDMPQKVAPNGDLEHVIEDRPVKKLHTTTTDEILSEIGLLNPHSIFITLSMGFLWFLSAMPTMSPAYLSPPVASCIYNCTFLTVQDEVLNQKLQERTG